MNVDISAPKPPEGPVPEAIAVLPQWLAEWQNNQLAGIPAPPPVLYHYTDTAGLIGIFKTNELWATNSLYTNDQTEVFHSLILLTQVINEAKKNRAEDVATDTMLIAAEEFGAIIEVFVVCFCRLGDLLSQWRGYGSSGGYALGFDSTVMKGLMTKHITLAPVIYDEDMQRQMISELVARWRELFNNAAPGEYNRQVRRLCAFVFAQAFSFMAATFKRHAFFQEDEWRLFYRRQAIIKDDSGLVIDFRERKGFPASYARIHLPAATDKVVAVRHVVLGPTPNWNLTGVAVSRLMQSAGYPDEALHITPSDVPLRP